MTTAERQAISVGDYVFGRGTFQTDKAAAPFQVIQDTGDLLLVRYLTITLRVARADVTHVIRVMPDQHESA